MTLRLTCPGGHQWDAIHHPVRSQDTQRICPQCGAPPVAQLVPAATSGATLPQSVPLAVAVAPRPDIQDYEILDELGRGGMGVVYKARHRKLKRMVALKMVLSGVDADARELARFKAEAEAVARLQHPNIVQIFEINEHEGRPFCALEYVPGGSLAQQFGGKALPPLTVAQLMVELAEGVHHAHEAGIIHRDLKPANILLGVEGEGWRVEGGSITLHPSPSTLHPSPSTLHPKVTDFGLAKQLDDPSGQTRSGTVLGTPSYMAPEQALGKVHNITRATDVWALGAILYECLTGRPPFRAESSLDTMLQVASQEPTAPTKLNPQVPRDLETICLKCLRKEPGKRYASARAFGEDVQRFLRHEPILARPMRTWERALRSVKRRPALSTAALLVLLVSFLGGTIAWQLRASEDVQKRQEKLDEDARQKQAAVEQLAKREKDAADLFLYAGKIRQVDQACQDGNFHRADELLRECPPAARGWEWHYLLRLCNWGTKRSFGGFEKGVRQVAYDRQGRLAILDATPGVQFWDAESGKRLSTVGAANGLVHALALSPDGKLLATAGADKVLRVYDAASGKEAYSKTFSAAVVAVAFSPDSTKLAATGAKPNEAAELRLFEAATGRPLQELHGHQGRLTSLAFSADSRYLTATSMGLGAFSWGVNDGSGPFTFGSKPDRVLFTPRKTQVAFLFQVESKVTTGTYGIPFQPGPEYLDAPDGGIRLGIAGGGGGGGFHSNSPDAKPGNQVLDAAFRPDGKMLALAGGWQAQGKLRIWRGDDLKEKLLLFGHSQRATSVSFAPDGLTLASGSSDGTLRLWDPTVRRSSSPLESRRPLNAPGGFPGGAGPDVVFSADGKRLATLDYDSAITPQPGEATLLASVWDIHTGQRTQCRAPLGPLRLEPLQLCFSGDGSRLALRSGGASRLVLLWETSGKLLRPYHDSDISSGELGPKGTNGFILASTMSHVSKTTKPLPGLRLVDPTTGQVQTALDQQSFWDFFPVVSPDGRRLAGMDIKTHTLTLWDTTAGKTLLVQSNTPGSLRFTPDGHYLRLHDTRTKTLAFWDAETGRKVEVRLPPTWSPDLMRFSPDGKLMATPTGENKVLVWDVIEGKERATLVGHGTAISDLVFSSDGQRLFTASSQDPIVKVWDTSNGQDLLSLRHARGGVFSLVLSPDGRQVASRGEEGVRIWDATPFLDGVLMVK